MKHFLLDNGTRIAVHFSGKKIEAGSVPLVLLHGFCEDSSLWHAVTPHLSRLPVVAIDLPGFGHSGVPVDATIAAYATAVITVLDALEVLQCVLVGHSLGGYVALEFAANRGSRLAGAGLFHSHPFPDNEDRKSVRRRGIDMLRSGKRDLYVSQLFPNLFTPAFVQAHPEVVNTLIAQGKKQPAAGIIAALQAMIGRRDHQETLTNAACPVLFLQGAEDGLVPVEQAWQAALLPKVAMMEMLPGVAHMGMLEAPLSCARILQDFYEMTTQALPGS